MILFLVALCSAVALQAQTATITLTGQLENYEEGTLTFQYQPYSVFSSLKTETAEVDELGKFDLEIDSDAAIRGFFSLGKVPSEEEFTFTAVNGKDSTRSSSTFDPRLIYVYMRPGDELFVSVDADDYKESLSFKGKSADNSYFMNYEDQKFNQYKDRFMKNWYSITAYEPQAFLELVNKKRDEKLSFLKKQTKYDISDDLRKIFEWDYIGEAVTRKLYYPSSRESYLKTETVLPDDYFNFMNDVEVAKESADLGVGYFYFLGAYLHKKYQLAESNEDFYDYISTVLENKALYEYYAFALRRDFKRELYDKFDEGCPYPELAAQVKKEYKHLEGMLSGNPAPEVTLLDTTGNKIQLADLQGSYVYLDFWATWCGPCIKEIPSLKALEREYHDKNIAFVSISFDDDKDSEKWIDFIKRRNLTGTQVRADEKNKAIFSKAFNIVQIPRFVIIDPQGNIVDANAQRPSDDRIRQIFNSLEGI